MCYYDMHVMSCECWKWGHFKDHCSKEYRTGETCGMRLLHTSHQVAERCKLCKKIDIKHDKIQKEHDNIKRWKRENERSRKASIEKSQALIGDYKNEIQNLEKERDHKKESIGYQTSRASSQRDASVSSGSSGYGGYAASGHSAGGYNYANVSYSTAYTASTSGYATGY